MVEARRISGSRASWRQPLPWPSRAKVTREIAKIRKKAIITSPAWPAPPSERPPTGEMPEVDSVPMACAIASAGGSPARTRPNHRIAVSAA